MTGAPTKFTEANRKLICELFEEGHFAQTVCDLVGIGLSTFHTWLDKGKKFLRDEEGEVDMKIRAHNEYAKFFKAVKKSQAKAEQAMVRCIRKAAEGYEELRIEYEVPSGKIASRDDWRAVGVTALKKSDAKMAIEFLKRRYPESWGDRQKVDSSTQVHVKTIKILDDKGRSLDMFGTEEEGQEGS